MPKRKAASKISGLLDDDVEEDDELIGARNDAPSQQEPDTAPPPAKRPRGRPKTAATTATATAASNAKPQTRKRRSAVVLGPKNQGAKGATKKATRKSNEDDAEKQPAVTVGGDTGEYDDSDNEAQGAQGASEDELGSPETIIPSNKKASQSRSHEHAGAEKHISTDGEFEYTPARSRKGRPQTKTRGGGRKTAATRQKSPTKPADEGGDGYWAAEKEELALQADGTQISDHNNYTSPVPISSPSKTQTKRSSSTGQKRKSVRIDETDNTDATLRRKLGDMTKKFENMDTKYRNLREVGIVEANANMEKLRKEYSATITASEELVASLKKELEMQSNLAQKSRSLQKQLKERDAEVSNLESKLEEMSSGLTDAQNETKALQTKLAASRNAAIGADGVQAKGSGTAKGASARNHMASGADATMASQVAQLKEDLYSDLTGLIVRDVKKQETQHLYDCIQTGLNGTLHFKLAVSDGTDKGSFEEAGFHYTPLLDSNRDRELLDILPDYLAVDITFSRQNAAKFYSRVVDTLTKKRVER